MKIKKALTLICTIMIIYAVAFCLNTSINKGDAARTVTNPATFGDIFMAYNLRTSEDETYRYFEPKYNASTGNQMALYYDFKETDETTVIVDGEGQAIKKETPFKNYIEYNAKGEDKNGNDYDFTIYMGDGSQISYLNYIGVNFEMKEIPAGIDQNYITGDIEWSERAWNSLQVNADSNAAASTFNIMSLGNMEEYSKNKMYMLVAQSVFASQTVNTDYVYWGTAIIAYLKPIERPVIIGEFTDRITKANMDMSGTISNNLPSQYTQVEYLQSSGTQYIDLQAIGNENSRVVIDYQVIGTYQFGYRLFGSRQASGNRGFFISSNSGNDIYADYGTQAFTSRIFDDSIRHLVDFNKNVLSLDGVVIKTFSSTPAFTTPRTLILFGGAQQANIVTKPFKIWSCKLYDNDVLIRNMIPAKRNSDNVAGMYDTVNNTFYTNEGTGTFTLGPAIQSSDSTQGELYYHLNSDIIYRLNIIPIIEEGLATSGNTVYRVETTFNNKTTNYYSDRLKQIIKVEKSTNQGATWTTQTIPANASNFTLAYTEGAMYRIYFRYNFGLHDNITNSAQLERNFNSIATVKLENANFTQDYITKITQSLTEGDSDITPEEIDLALNSRLQTTAGVEINTIEERGNL